MIFYKSLTIEERQEDGSDKEKQIPLLRSFVCFNANQADGPPDKFTAVPESCRHQWEVIADAEAVVKDYVNRGPRLITGGDRACYSPVEDTVRVPEPEKFAIPERYYSTLFHELTHSTGHKSRLNREGMLSENSFGTPVYAAEELIAEMGAAMLCAHVGMDQAETIPQSAAYVDNWLHALKSNKKLVLTAAAGAQRAVDLIDPELGELAELEAA